MGARVKFVARLIVTCSLIGCAGEIDPGSSAWRCDGVGCAPLDFALVVPCDGVGCAPLDFALVAPTVDGAFDLSYRPPPIDAFGIDATFLCPQRSMRCVGRVCGNDGFDGTCGTCAAGQTCSLDGQCVACTPNCTGPTVSGKTVCGDDGCGGSCGTCSTGLNCSQGECIPGQAQDVNELMSLFYMNEYRTATSPRVDTCVCTWDAPWAQSPTWCTDGSGTGDPYCANIAAKDTDKTHNYKRCDTGPVMPSRMNADRLLTSRLIAQHQTTYVETTKQGWCGHADPLKCTCNGSPCDASQPGAQNCKSSLDELYNAYLDGVGLQNIWCGCPSPDGAAITGDPYHCFNMTIGGANDFAVGQVGDSNACYQVQDPGGSAAFVPIIINNEAVSTGTPTVNVTVWPGSPAIGHDVNPSAIGLAHLDRITDVELSEDPCFTDAAWQPYNSTLVYTLSSGVGRKVLYGRVRDVNGFTAVSWDSIYLGPDPSAYSKLSDYLTALGSLGVSSLKEGMTRIRSVRIPSLSQNGFDAFEYNIGTHREAETMGVWGMPQFFVVDDPDASMGKAMTLSKPGATDAWAVSIIGGVELPPQKGAFYLRMKVADNTNANAVLGGDLREDNCGDPKNVAAPQINFAFKGTDFAAKNTYQWFRIPFERKLPCSLFYFEMGIGSNPGLLIDRWDVYTEGATLAATQSGTGVTLDFSTKNYRGIEMQLRYVNSQSGAYQDGPRINPYCSLCN